MEKIKVLLSSRPRLLSEVIRNMIEHQMDMEVVGEVMTPNEFLHFPRHTPVDAIIITPHKSYRVTKICHQLLEEHAQLKVMTFSAKCEAAYLYQPGVPRKRINYPSEQSIFGAIRTTMLSKVGSPVSNSDAVFVGWQKSLSGEDLPLYNIIAQNHPSIGSTVSEKTLSKLKLQVPKQHGSKAKDSEKD